ncbi:MAG: 3-phosphoshikimate 1-carboxyvinyltransferase [Acidimicrobiales bacterium]
MGSDSVDEDILTITPGRPLVGRVRAPGDKSISHRALLLGALAQGETVIRGLSDGDDVRRTARAVAALGADVRQGRGEVVVRGGSLHEPLGPIDLGNSGTGMRLLTGVVAGFDWLTILHGDESLSRRPMDRVADPLRSMGATLDGREGGRYPPLVIRGGELRGIDYTPPVASAQLKSAVLLAGLHASGATTVHERVRTRAHTEEMLAAFGARIDVDDAAITVYPSALVATRVDVPVDPSHAAFWVVAGCVVPGSDITVEDVYVGHGRAGFVDVLGRMGADIDVVAKDATTADIRARAGALRATVVEGDEVPGLIDEIPVLAVAAAYAEGTTEFRDAAELTVKETDRVATTVAMLRALGVGAEPRADGFVVRGGRPHGADLDTAGDHRIAMAGAVAALGAETPSTLRGWRAVDTSYPGFAAHLEQLRG